MNVTRSVDVRSITAIGPDADSSEDAGAGAGGVRVVADVGVLRATAPALERGRHRAHHTFETYIAEALALVNLTVADVRIKG